MAEHTDIVLVKKQGVMVPATDADVEKLAKIKPGQGLAGPWRKQHERMLWMHKKFFKMLEYAFDVWEPEPPDSEKTKIEYEEAFGAWTFRGIPIQKNRERFREQMIILAGFYEPEWDINGNLRLKAKSMSFANMEQDEFDVLYYAVHDVIRQRILTNYSREELDEVLAEHEQFA